MAFIAFIFLGLIFFSVIISSFGFNFGKYSYNAQDQDLILGSVSLDHPLGTDQLGRDMLSRLIHGGKLSISVAFITAFISFFMGIIFGTFSGLFPGKIDFLITRIIDTIYSLPDLLVLSILGLIFNRSTLGILLAIGLISWMDVARLTRAEILKFKNHDFILSARAIGLDNFEIFYKHLFPNILPIVLVAITFTMPRAIVAESTLSFLGLGLSPPDCSWGTLASDGWQFLNTHPNLILFPSLMIMLTVLSFNILGDFLGDLNSNVDIEALSSP